ncbi:MAG: alpha/beta fold hydrolase [Pigmentiphaga sp.]
MRLNPQLPRQTTPLDDTKIAFIGTGQGRPILLVHGSLCDYRYWTPQLRTLSAHGEVRAVSLRYCWPNPPATEAALARAPYSVGQHADDLARCLEHWNWSDVDLVGHSRGARVALELALRAPHRPRTLTLADPALPDATDDTPSPYAVQAAAAIRAGNLEAGVGGFVDAVNGPDTWRRMIADFRQMALDNAGTLLLQAAETLPLPSAAALAGLRCPVLLLGGANSPARYGKARHWLQERMPHASSVVIAGAAHGMNLARPQAFQEALGTFWSTTA